MTVDRRLAELAARFTLAPAAVGSLAALLELVAHDASAPTTVIAPPIAVDVHLADSLVALDVDAVRAAGRIADLGAGAGFPGIPLAIALPGANVALVESVGRKGTFLRRAVEVCGASNAEVVVARAEQWPSGLGACDVVTARAVAPLAVLVEYAAPLLVNGGTLIAWKGRRDESEETDGAAAARATGLRPAGVTATAPWPDARDHHLHLYVKVSSTPNRFPRRPGVARKRPLRADSVGSGEG